MPKREPITKITLSEGAVRYRVRVDAGFHLDGRRRQIHRTYRTYKEAVAGLAKIRSEAARGEFIGRRQVTVQDYFNDWLASKRKIRASTRQQYRDVSKHFLEAYGQLPLQSLTKAHMDSAVEAMLTTGGRSNEGRSPSYVKAFLVAWGQCLDMAVSEQIIKANPARLVERPSIPLPEPHTWTPVQAATFIGAIEGHPWEALWRLTMAGLRRGEVMGLPWGQIDLDLEIITIQQTRILVDGKVMASDPKTRRGVRVLPMWPDLTASIKRLKLRQAQERLAAKTWPTDLLAVHSDGKPINPRHYSDSFQEIARGAGLPIIPLKNARHTSVTLMRDKGIPDHIVASWHGHDESVMRAVYTDSQTKPMLAAAKVLQDVSCETSVQSSNVHRP